MPKYIIKEGLVEKFLTKLYDAMIKGKAGRIHIKQDKELDTLIADAEKAHKKLVTHFEQRRKDDPDLAKKADWLRKNL